MVDHLTSIMIDFGSTGSRRRCNKVYASPDATARAAIPFFDVILLSSEEAKLLKEGVMEFYIFEDEIWKSLCQRC